PISRDEEKSLIQGLNAAPDVQKDTQNKVVERSKLIGREHMMQNELSLLGSLCHPRVVRLFAHHHTHTHSYLVMELVSGGDLFEAISDRGKFSEAEAGLMVSDVSEALNYIHCKSIVHRDLKPENLLVGICRLKLGDFGLAMVVTEPVFTVCGTPTYVAPEILCETGYGVAVDIWALGVILYILLCGFPPFRSQDRDQEELFKLIKQAQLHFLSPYWDPISEGETYRNTQISYIHIVAHKYTICVFPVCTKLRRTQQNRTHEESPRRMQSTSCLHRSKRPHRVSRNQSPPHKKYRIHIQTQTLLNSIILTPRQPKPSLRRYIQNKTASIHHLQIPHLHPTHLNKPQRVPQHNTTRPPTQQQLLQLFISTT
uniref:Protein kinase domain-containing protein n=1 Tax=Amphiprion ocellaris TaxID=80972 RepID=A0AAQ5XK46_AMPOC